MTRVTIDCDRIKGWPSFHHVFAETMGFPDFYGENMDAWIDCMSYLDDPDAGMSTVTCEKGEFVILELLNVTSFKARCPEQYDALIDCSAFVNFRNLEIGERPLIMLSFET